MLTAYLHGYGCLTRRNNMVQAKGMLDDRTLCTFVKFRRVRHKNGPYQYGKGHFLLRHPCVSMRVHREEGPFRR